MMTTSGGVPILEERDISIEITWCTNISMCKGTIYCGSPYRFVAAFVLRGSCPSLPRDCGEVYKICCPIFCPFLPNNGRGYCL